MSGNLFLYLALALYGVGTVTVLVSVVQRQTILQKVALAVMSCGLVAHTIWIGVICSTTKHPPLTNLPEASAFIGWTILAVTLVLYIRYRVNAAAFFVYPLVFLLLSIPVVVRAPMRHLSPALQSNLFIAHLFLTTVGIATLLVALAFALLYRLQERAIKAKRQGVFYEWVPSLRVCDLVGYRALSIGFSIYTLGILAGVLWSYRTSGGFAIIGAKEAGALAAWILFAVLLQSYMNGSFRTQKALVVSVAAFVSILVALFGIRHV